MDYKSTLRFPLTPSGQQHVNVCACTYATMVCVRHSVCVVVCVRVCANVPTRACGTEFQDCDGPLMDRSACDCLQSKYQNVKAHTNKISQVTSVMDPQVIMIASHQRWMSPWGRHGACQTLNVLPSLPVALPSHHASQDRSSTCKKTRYPHDHSWHI